MQFVNILLVGKDEVDEINVKRTLARKDILYRVKVARNGEEALQLLRQPKTDRDKPDLVIIDLDLPKMSGIELLREIRKDEGP